MHYKTMVLELIRQSSSLYEQLRASKTLLPTMEWYALQLKASHETWKSHLHESKPGSSLIQISSEALELALQEFQETLPPESLPRDKEEEPLSLDGAMEFLRRHTPPEYRPSVSAIVNRPLASPAARRPKPAIS